MELYRTLTPTCTGTTVVAFSYDEGVAILTDRLVSYGKMARYKHVSRQYRVNDDVVVTFGGDYADFQWLQNVIERQTCKLRAYDPMANLSPKMLHAYLTSLLYYRRTQLDPIWNILVTAGMEKEGGDKNPYIGVITQRGVAYSSDTVATGIGAMLLNQAMETEFGKLKATNSLNRDQATAVLRKAIELALYHDCVADNEYEITIVDRNGVALGKPEKVTGNWDIAEYNCDYE
ncbi:unnamed protein product [Enterobius vermicularis]|uniref:Proteasome subunit beta n=1 Tax=Enterobius vermicularis TaxID=51028 RepID=A0A158QAM6_ENTVE|nr:unnamed protein product [Enterobius vermicularis]